jgi:hypothetical protein
MKIPSLTSGHFARGDGKCRGAGLANEKNNQRSSRLGLAVSDVQMLASDPPFFNPPNVRLAEQNFFNFIGYYAMLLLDLGSEAVVPNNLLQAQAWPSIDWDTTSTALPRWNYQTWRDD